MGTLWLAKPKIFAVRSFVEVCLPPVYRKKEVSLEELLVLLNKGEWGVRAVVGVIEEDTAMV